MSTESDTEKREAAALQLAEDRLPDRFIAAKAGITVRQLTRWKQQPAFAARVTALRGELRAAVVEHGIADKQARIAGYDSRLRLMWQVIAERAADGQARNVPGAETGLMTRQYKPAPGSRAGLVEEWAVDTGMLSEMRATEKQAAQELGEWTEKRDVSSGGEPVRFTIQIDRRATTEDAPSE